jgi:hypothetical protein
MPHATGSDNGLVALLKGGQNNMLNEIGIPSFFVVTALSLAAALFASFLYTRFYSSRATGSEVHRAFPLLGVSITTIFLCIQFSLPLSLGLLGALSIVRFRTPIKEPEEVGFIMLVIAQALACATYNFVFLGILMIFAVLGILLMNAVPGLRNRLASGGVILIRLPESEYDGKASELFSVLKKEFKRPALDSLTNLDGKMVLTYSFAAKKDGAIEAVKKSIDQISNEASMDIYFMRPRSL